MVYGNCKFYKQREKGEGLKWRCVKRDCLAKIYTDRNATVITKSDMNHNHDLEKNLKRQAISNSAKRKALDEVNKRPQKLIRREISGAPSSFTEELDVKYMEYIRKKIE